MILLDRLFGRKRDDRAGLTLYNAVVAQARLPVFYRDLGVPDTLDGRFDLVALHAFLIMRRLKGAGPEAESLSRRLYEMMVDDFDRSLREMGIGDTGVGKRVKAMVRAVQGRLHAYDRALDHADPAHLDAALDNNLYGTVREAEPAWRAAVAAYLRRQAEALALQPLAEVMAGHVRFAEPAI